MKDVIDYINLIINECEDGKMKCMQTWDNAKFNNYCGQIRACELIRLYIKMRNFFDEE